MAAENTSNWSMRQRAMKVKHTNWFAAGPEVNRALTLLSDGAFRLYFYLCLQAVRDTGSVSASYADLAKALSKSRRSIVTYFEELRRHGVCQVQPAVNQHQDCEIEICDEFWPYTRSEAGLNPADSRAYILQIRTLLAGRACIKCAFTAPDQKFATALLASDVSLGQIERAIALGCSRKYVSCLNGADCGPIVSFTYFRDLIEEAGDTETPVGYWDYVMPQLKRLESQWIARKSLAGAKSASAGRQKSKQTK